MSKSGNVGQTHGVANLKAGDLTGFDRDEKGRITTTRSEMGRQHALQILQDPEYQENLARRLKAGEGGAIEVWVWRIGYGDPARPREGDEGEMQRFDQLRDRLRAFMKENPDEAREMAALLSRPKLVALPKPKGDDPPA